MFFMSMFVPLSSPTISRLPNLSKDVQSQYKMSEGVFALFESRNISMFFLFSELILGTEYDQKCLFVPKIHPSLGMEHFWEIFCKNGPFLLELVDKFSSSAISCETFVYVKEGELNDIQISSENK